MSEFNQFLSTNKDILKSLIAKKIFVVTPLSTGGLLNSDLLASVNASIFKGKLGVLEKIITSDFVSKYETPIIIDCLKAVELYEQQQGSEENRIKQAVLLSRISFMGTDGMRGKTSTDHKIDPIKSLLAHNLLTPQLIELNVYGFSNMLIDAGFLKQGDTACVCNDGRDITTNWAFNSSMLSGFNNAGVGVLDLGISPTPFVPYKMLKEGFSAGAVLTASHNPSNQNGIKFFFNGNKILPEGTIGDYSFAAWVYDAYLKGIKNTNLSDKNSNIDISKEAIDLMKKVIPPELKSVLKDSYIVLDSANGAFHGLAQNILDEYNINYICINESANGSNINRNCGVAEVEGQEEFSGADYDSSLQVIKTIFDKGRQIESPVYGIVLDGDGDRGFILCYDKQNDKVLVIDGDKSGYIMAMYYKHLGIDISKLNFVTTVESDIMTAFSANTILDINTPIVSVGDKWIGSYSAGELLLGLEASGHLIFPIKFESTENKLVELRSGNGLLTTLMTLVGITTLKLTAHQAFEPYESGFSKTFYTYFVDKTLFFKGSSIWNSDKKILMNEFQKLHSKNQISAHTSIEIQDKEDSHMLYASINKGDKQLAAIFCRNSGTEDKAAVYVKCKHELRSLLLPIGEALRDNHVNNMKNPNRKEYQWELIMLETLNSKNNLSINELKKIVEKKTDKKIAETDFHAVIYGLKKEGRLCLENSLINLNKGETDE
ncbi:MAG: hypothetical protein OCD02_17410 [Spirochaetaceae bacterium]